MQEDFDFTLEGYINQIKKNEDKNIVKRHESSKYVGQEI